MSPNSGNPRDLALHRLTVAKEDLATAKDDFIGKHFRAANNRAYYSIYHSITAVLALEQVAFKRHKDTIAYFNKDREIFQTARPQDWQGPGDSSRQ